jgi:hypothetical protein
MPDTYDITGYIPALSEIPTARIRDLRAASANLVSLIQPDLDTRPNTPYGDLFLSPAAVGMAVDEVMWSRFLSDLNPENAALGTVYNCEFVTRFFLNFGIHDDGGVEAAGMLRLQFTSGERREIDAGTVFLLGTDYYRPLLPSPGPCVLLSPDATPENDDTNIIRYAMFDADSWVADILVSGLASADVTTGTTASVDRTVDGLSGVSALAGFDTGAAPTKLQELARRIRTNFHSRTPSTRGGAINMIRRRFPSFGQVSAVVSGDFEMCRDASNQAGVAAGRLDILVRSKQLVADSVVVRLVMSYDSSADYWRGWLNLPEIPVLITGIGNGTEVFEHTLYSVSGDTMKPGLSAAYGSAERLFVSMEDPLDEGGSSKVTRVSENGEDVAYLTVEYLFDPDLASARRYAETDECDAAGLDIYTKGFIPAVISDLAVQYYRSAGVSLNLAQARLEIVDGFNAHTPASPAGAHTITDSMVYAGAHSVRSIELAAEVRMSVADKVWIGTGTPDPVGDWEAFEADCENVPSKSLTSIYSPDMTIADDGVVPLFAAAGERNTAWLLPSSALRLIELKSV